ncbi:MAG: nuclease domain-containing protein [Rhodospirillales bacterium]
MNLRKEAKNRECQMRLLSVCNRDDATVVLAHVRLAGVTGVGQKAFDALGCWCCSECHRYQTEYPGDDQIQRSFYEGVIRTQYQLIKEDKIRW